MCRRGLQKSAFQPPLGPDSGPRMVPDSGIRIGPLLDPAFALSGAPRSRFWPKAGGRFWHQNRPAFVPSFSPLRFQTILGSLEQTFTASAHCKGLEHADRSEPGATWQDPLLSETLLRASPCAGRLKQPRAARAKRRGQPPRRRGGRNSTRFRNFTDVSRRSSALRRRCGSEA